ncbi:hypothetical protein WAJ24_22975, partial [Acinetobacter baumannii]
FDHFGVVEANVKHIDDIQFRKPDDHSADAFEKVAEAVYLANDPIFSSNFDRMYRIVQDLKFLARSMERNEKEGHSAHGLLF